MLPFSSGGPREDGGFKPNVTAPGSAISTTPLWQAGSSPAESGYTLPGGYASERHVDGLAADGGRLRTAALGRRAGRRHQARPRPPPLYTQAVYNYEVPAFLQGLGQIDVPRTWSLLKRGVDDSRITTTAPVCTNIWNLLGETDGHRPVQPLLGRRGRPGRG